MMAFDSPATCRARILTLEMRRLFALKQSPCHELVNSLLLQGISSVSVALQLANDLKPRRGKLYSVLESICHPERGTSESEAIRRAQSRDLL